MLYERAPREIRTAGYSVAGSQIEAVTQYFDPYWPISISVESQDTSHATLYSPPMELYRT